MKKLLIAAIVGCCAAPVLAQNPNPPGLSETHLAHRVFKGGQVHEAETDGVRDGIVIWKNGTKQAIHNGRLGKWFPTTFAREGDPPNRAGEAPDGARHAFAGPRTLGQTTATAAYLAAAANGLLSPVSTAILDDYVFVSPQQVTAWGGLASAVNQVHLAADAMNEAFGHSGVDAHVNIVGIAQYDVSDSTVDAELTALQTRYQSGAFSALRTSTGFDTLTLMTTAGDLCGESFIYYAPLPLRVVNGNCATANMSYAHEAGHTLGLMHNAGATGYAAACGATAVGYGAANFRTVMSYPGGPRTRQYSAPPPAVWYSDGISAVGTTSTNASACLVITTPIVAAWNSAIVTPPPPVHTAPTAVTWTESTAALSWTHTRPTDLASYKVAVDGAGATSLGLPATNVAPLTLAAGSHSLVLSACYVDTTCVAATAVTVTAGATSITYNNLTPAAGATFKAAKGKGKSGITFSVTAVDNSGIASVVLHWGTGASSATKSGDVYTVKIANPTLGAHSWYFTLTAKDGEVVNTTTRTVTVQ